MRKSPDGALLSVFRAQAGVITRAQALALGMSDRQIGFRLASQRWVQLRRGVYGHSAFERSDDMRVQALILGGNGHVSHRHAAQLHGLDPVLKRKPEVTLRRGTHLEYGDIIVHESTQMDRADLDVISGFPVTGVERTIMDVAAVERRQWAVLALIDSAREQGKTTGERLHRCLELHARRGRDGTVRFREALKVARFDEPPAIGPFSRRVAAMLRSAGLPYPRMEEDIHDPVGVHVARADLSFDVPLLIFLDGFTYHGQRRKQTNRDRQQRQQLRSMGFNVLEFTWDQYRRDPGFVTSQSVRSYYDALRLGSRRESAHVS